MAQPQISVIVCTRDRAHNLVRTLGYYEKVVSNVPWELIVVDNGSSDGTAQILRDYASRGTIPLRLLFEPQPGLSRARNTGWKSVSGAIAVFTDDDCYPLPDFVNEIWNNFSDSSIDYLGGRVLPFDPDDYPITFQTCDSRIVIEPNSFISAGIIHGANLAARKRILEATGGFDELLGAGSRIPAGEDVDFVSRVSAAGYCGAYDPGPVVMHHHRRQTMQQVSALRRSYDVGRGAYYMKCILDSTRRRLAVKNWYWSIRTRIRNSIGSPRNLLGIVYEFVGAAEYLFFRTAGLVRSK